MVNSLTDKRLVRKNSEDDPVLIVLIYHCRRCSSRYPPIMPPLIFAPLCLPQGDWANGKLAEGNPCIHIPGLYFLDVDGANIYPFELS